METYLQHQRPTDETTLINMILRKWMIFWQCHTIFRITYSYTYMHNVEIKGLILNSLSKGSKHKKVDIKSSHQRWLLTQWLSRQKEWATFVVDVIIYKVTAIQMRKFSSRYHFSLKIDLYLQNRINLDTSKLSMMTPPPSKKNLTSMERAINPFLVVEILSDCLLNSIKSILKCLMRFNSIANFSAKVWCSIHLVIVCKLGKCW